VIQTKREGAPAVVAVMAVTLLALTAPGSGQTKQPASAPHGDAKGLALLARVHAAYRHVPAVQSGARVGPERLLFRLLLRAGVATAEEFLGVGPGGTTTLLARGSGPTYAREPGTSCWRRLAPSDSQSLEDVGLRFPDAYKMVVKAPRRAGAFWLLPVVSQGRYPGEGGKFTMHINATTMLLQSQTGSVGGHYLTQYVHALARRPKLPTPTPTC
jgi:hypothetical protein